VLYMISIIVTMTTIYDVNSGGDDRVIVFKMKMT